MCNQQQWVHFSKAQSVCNGRFKRRLTTTAAWSPCPGPVVVTNVFFQNLGPEVGLNGFDRHILLRILQANHIVVQFARRHPSQLCHGMIDAWCLRNVPLGMQGSTSIELRGKLRPWNFPQQLDWIPISLVKTSFCAGFRVSVAKSFRVYNILLLNTAQQPFFLWPSTRFAGWKRYSMCVSSQFCCWQLINLVGV